MSEYRTNKHMDNTVKAVVILLCGAVFAGVFFIYPKTAPKNEAVMALAEENGKAFKWTKRAVDEGTTVDAGYLWPDEVNPSFTAVYRDGRPLSDEKMVTIMAGSVYHFRGASEDANLYTEVYVGSLADTDVMSGETGTWYRLLPSAVRSSFEESGWTWKTGWEYTGRAYLDSENSRVMIKDNDHTAVLYGIGLYLDDKYDYADDKAFEEEGSKFRDVFGSTDNLFALALECYYTRGGELRSTCPEIYAMVADAMAQRGGETAGVRENAASPEAEPSEPVLKKDLLEYANTRRGQAGLQPVVWDDADDGGAVTRAKEISTLYSQTRPDGTDAFSAYTDAAMCEMRFTDAVTAQDIFNCAESYFLMQELTSFNCAVYNGVGVLVFIWQ